MNEKYLIPASIVLSAGVIAVVWTYKTGLEIKPLAQNQYAQVSSSVNADGEIDGETLQAVWGNLGQQLVEAGVIDKEKFLALHEKRGDIGDSEKELLEGIGNRNLKINKRNAGYMLNLFWALGLGNKNPILENGPMQKYGDPVGFASTGGWTIANGNAMDHYSRHAFISLTREQQILVEKVSQSVYRPCCNNSTYFPDCNHGMAMLGFLELMASQGVSESEMYQNALIVNSYWFPKEYATINKYLVNRNLSLVTADPKEILGTDYSSGSGYKKVLSQVVPVEQKGGGDCGV